MHYLTRHYMAARAATRILIATKSQEVFDDDGPVPAIVRGDEPGGLSLERLVKGVPAIWKEQRTMIDLNS